MIPEYSKVKIKTTGIQGEVIDRYTVGGQTYYAVESVAKGVPGGVWG